MNWIKNSLTLLASLAIAFILAEIVLRVLDIGYGFSPTERSPIFHHIRPSNYSFRLYDPNEEYGGYNLYYDESGYRVSQPSESNFLSKDSAESIVLIGDSFTEGNQVHFEDTYVDRLATLLDVPALNLGVSSYSPLINLFQVKYQVAPLKASLVILQVYGNDFEGDFRYLADAQYTQNKASTGNIATTEQRSIIGIHGGENNLPVIILRKSYLARFVRKSQLLIRALAAQNKAAPTGGVNKNNRAFTYEQSVNPEHLQATSNTIEEIRDELSKHNKTLQVFMIPSKFLSRQNQCCEDDRLYQQFKAEMEKREIPFLDVSGYFKDHNNQDDLFFNIDIHLTALGHEVLADALFRELQRKRLLSEL